MVGEHAFDAFVLPSGTAFDVVLYGSSLMSKTAFIDSLRYRNEVYRAADTRTKTFWTVLLGVAVAIGFLAMPPLQAMPIFISLLGFVAAAVYFTDVRKGLRAVDPRYRGR